MSHTPPGEDLNSKKCTVAATYAKWKFDSKAAILPILENFWRAIFEKIQKFGQKQKTKKVFDVHMDTILIVNNIKRILKFLIFPPNFCAGAPRAENWKISKSLLTSLTICPSKNILKFFIFLGKFLNFLKNGLSKNFQNWSDIRFWAKFSFGIGGIYTLQYIFLDWGPLLLGCDENVVNLDDGDDISSNFTGKLWKYSHSQWLFFEFISNFTNKLVKQSLRVTVCNAYVTIQLKKPFWGSGYETLTIPKCLSSGWGISTSSFQD